MGIWHGQDKNLIGNWFSANASALNLILMDVAMCALVQVLVYCLYGHVQSRNNKMFVHNEEYMKSPVSINGHQALIVSLESL